MYARYNAIVEIEVTTENAAEYTVINTASTHVTRIEFTGVRYLGLICPMNFEPGMPPSREKANHIRAIEVIEPLPHSHMAPAIITPMTLAKNGAKFSRTIYNTGYGSFAVAAMSVTDHVSASIKM